MKDTRDLLQQAEAQGWRVIRGRHFKLLSPDGKGIVVLAVSPSDHRAMKNVKSHMRRYGFED